MEIERLQQAIRDLHGLESTHLRSESVRETFRGETVWEGMVEVFAVTGHPKAASPTPGATRRTRVGGAMSRS